MGLSVDNSTYTNCISHSLVHSKCHLTTFNQAQLASQRKLKLIATLTLLEASTTKPPTAQSFGLSSH
jgi:hypothetical protein